MNDGQFKFVDIGNCRTPEMVRRYQEIAEEGYDPFEPEVFREEHGRPIICENDDWILTTNQYPYKGVRHHFLLVCKSFVRNATELSPQMWANLQELLKVLEEKYRLDGHVMFMRMGNTKKTGASVVRLHVHIIAPGGEPNERFAIYPTISKK